MTFSQWFEEWMEYKVNEIKPTSLSTYRKLYNAQIKGTPLDKKRIDQIRPEDIQRLYNNMLKKEMSKKSIGVCAAVIGNSLKRAERCGYIARNPAPLAVVPKQAREARHHIALTVEEQKLFMERAEGSEIRNLLVLMLNTGLRIGEATGLKHSDVDRKGGVIHVRRTLTYGKGGFHEGPPKSKTSRRDVPLTEKASRAIKSERRRHGVESLAGFVFVRLDGAPFSEQQVNREIGRIVESARQERPDFPHVTAHDLRDTFATRCIENGMQPNTLKTILGHSTIAMTLDLYAKVLPDQARAEMDKIAAAL